MQRTPPTGTRAVIIGNGPSVDVISPTFWREAQEDTSCLLVGTNRALCLVALQGVRLDAVVLRDTYRGFWQDQQLCCRYHNELWKPAACWRVGPAASRVTFCDEFVRTAPGWQYEIVRDKNDEYAVMTQSTVVLFAAGWAWLHGCRDIGLVGFDYRPGRPKMLEPYESTPQRWLGQYEKPVPDYIERQCKRSRAAVESHGGRLVNLSSGSLVRGLPLCSTTDFLR